MEFLKPEQLHPKSLKKILRQTGCAPLPTPLGLTLQSKMVVNRIIKISWTHQNYWFHNWFQITQSNIYTQNQVCTKMPKHNTEKSALKSNSSLTLKHKRTNIGILFQKSKISKRKDSIKMVIPRTKSIIIKKTATMKQRKKQKDYKLFNVHVLHLLTISAIERRLYRASYYLI